MHNQENVNDVIEGTRKDLKNNEDKEIDNTEES